MADELISRQAALWAVMRAGCLANTVQLLKDAPAVDAVEVVRCGECKYWWLEERCSFLCSYPDEPLMNADDFCSYGERREDI